MQASDLTVEVRDINLIRQGVIPPSLVNVKVSPVLNGLGTWSLSLPANHALAKVLSTPGAGIIVTGPNDVIMSGPVTSVDKTVSTSAPGGTVDFSGVSDDVILSDMLAFPQPSNVDPTTQTLAWDVRTAAAETLMRQYVDANVGPSAPSPRKRSKLILATDQGRGPSVTKSARFPVLGDLLNEIATVSALTFRIVQRNSNLVFEVGSRTDRSATVRFDIYNGNLSSQEVTIAPPNATNVIVAGQGDLVARQFIARTNATAQVDSATWGRYIEVWVDQRNTAVVAELQTAGDEVLAASGFTQVSTKIVPTDTTGMTYGTDFNIGDTVTIVVDDVEQKSYISGVNVLSDDKGTRVGVVLGDLAAMDTVVASQQQADDLEARVENLEKNTGAYTGTGWTAAAYVNGWVDFGGGYQSLRYRRTTTNQVEIQGLIKSGTGLIFTLPVGYRPNAHIQVPIVSNGLFGHVEIKSDGTVTLITGNNAYVAIQTSFGL